MADSYRDVAISKGTVIASRFEKKKIVTNVCTDEERRLHESPCCEVALALLECQVAISAAHGRRRLEKI